MGLFDKFGNKNAQPRTRRTDAVSGIPFPAYKGRKSYMFISYAHVDSPTVFSLIAEYYDLGYNVWYDEGIEPGIEWPEEIGKALGGSKLFVVFMSPAAAASGNVRNEINFAIKHHIPLITVYIEETELTAGLDLQIGARQAINWYNMDKESYRRKFTYSFDAVLRPGSRPVVPYDVPASPAKPDVHEPNPSAPPAAPSPAVQTVPLPASSTDDIRDGFKWDGSKLLSYLGDAKEILLPASASMLCSSVFRGNGTIETITIPASVSKIDTIAFDNCPNLKRVVIEGGYVAVGSPVAAGCPNLSFRCHRNSQAYNNLKQAFTGPVSFFAGEDFDIEHGRLNKYLGSDTVVRLPKEVEIIGGFAFNNCPDLESVIYAGDNGAIFDNAFIGCPKLRNITIGKSFSSIAPKAFIGCPNVRFSYYRGRKPDRFDTLFPDPSIASEIAPDEEIIVSSATEQPKPSPNVPDISGAYVPDPDFVVEDGVLKKYLGVAQNPKVPPIVTEIGPQAFAGCASIVEVAVPFGVKSIGVAAFVNCVNLETLIIPKSVTSIAYGAFTNCSKLTILCDEDTTSHREVAKVWTGRIAFTAIPSVSFGEWVGQQTKHQP